MWRRMAARSITSAKPSLPKPHELGEPVPVIESKEKQSMTYKQQLDRLVQALWQKDKPRPTPNVVLPSYEKQLRADNSVRAQSTAIKGFYNLLHSINPMRSVLSTPQDVRSIVVIGVHGWFPARFIQKVIGEPTGTASRFAEKMGEAVKAYFQDKYDVNLDQNGANVTLIHTQNEGLVEDRVEHLMNYLLEYIDVIRDADVVLFAAHSQGTPVSIMLCDQLIKEDVLFQKRQQVGILAMAGILHGPFPHLRSNLVVRYVEKDPARQLFDLNFPNSSLSRQLHSSMANILESGVRVTAVGSWYDQVVPLYSSIMHGFEHPNIYRAIFIKGADYSPDFLSHLVVFALKLRNAGVAEHDVIVHLSEFVAGNLYGFGTQGHSTLYDELNTYTVAIAWTLNDFRVVDTNQIMRKVVSRTDSWIHSFFPGWIQDSEKSLEERNARISRKFYAPSKINPYYLPWVMNKLLNDKKIGKDKRLREELNGLLHLFSEWSPSRPSEKELRFRLEPLKAKL